MPNISVFEHTQAKAVLVRGYKELVCLYESTTSFYKVVICGNMHHKSKESGLDIIIQIPKNDQGSKSV